MLSRPCWNWKIQSSNIDFLNFVVKNANFEIMKTPNFSSFFCLKTMVLMRKLHSTKIILKGQFFRLDHVSYFHYVWKCSALYCFFCWLLPFCNISRQIKTSKDAKYNPFYIFILITSTTFSQLCILVYR